MQKNNHHIKKFRNIQQGIVAPVFVFAISLISSCEKFIEVDVSKSQVTKDVVFSNDITASAALTGIYGNMSSESGFASGQLYYSITALCSMSADDVSFDALSSDFNAFDQHVLLPRNSVLEALWNSLYKTIYEANAVLEGLEKSTGVSPALKSRLKGEALFIRAFAYFYLVNTFGDVPLITTIDFKTNAVEPRSTQVKLYELMTTDLVTARDLLGDAYFTLERVRPNKSTVNALLARVYLYNGEWANAEAQASAVINNTGQYGLVSTIDSAFLKNNREAIWQFMPWSTYKNTNEGDLFILGGTPNSGNPFVITTGLLNAFEATDVRKAKWINSITPGSITYHYPFKYKRLGGPASTPAVPLDEYSTIFRLAEQYLIRAEARAHLNKLTGINSTESDINSIRNRAGLGNTTATTQPQLLLAVEQERRVELFTEWGHRWFDLKRTNRADAVLAPVKNNWNPEDVLYPLPQIEMAKNPFLKPQNPGY